MEGPGRRVALAVGLVATLGAWAVGLLWVLAPPAEREEAFGGYRPAAVADFTIETTLSIDRHGATRVTAVTAPGQPKAVQAYHEGRIDGPTLIRELGAALGVRDDRYRDECIRTYNLAGTTIDLETAKNEDGVPGTKALITESVQNLVDRGANFRVCFPGGMPGPNASGSVTVVVRDFDVIAVSPTPNGSKIEAGERRYVWDRLDEDQTISIDMRRPALAFLAELPGLSAYSLIPGTAGQLLGTIAYLILASIPALLLLWALSIYGRDFPVPARRIAESIAILAGTLAVAPLLPFLVSPLVQPTLTGLDELGANLAVTFGVSSEQQFDLTQAGLYFAGLVVAGILVLLARVAEIPWLSWLTGLIGRGIALQLAIMVVGAIVIVLAVPFGGQRLALRLAVWLVNALLIGTVLGILAAGLRHVATDRLARLLQFRWVFLTPFALWLGIPTEDRVREFRGESLAEYAYSVNDELFALSASSDVLLLVAAVVAAWGLWHRSDHTAGSPLPTWEDALDDSSLDSARSTALILPTATEGTRAGTVFALARAIFAGLLVGKVGVIAGVPVALVVAFLIFPIVFNPLGVTAVLAAVATRLRDYRPELARTVLEGEGTDSQTVAAEAATAKATVATDDQANLAISAPTTAGRVSLARAAWQRGLVLASPPIVPRLTVLSLGPSASPWLNAVRSTRYGLLLQMVPLLIYAAFFLPGTLNSNDPRLWLDLVSRLTLFVSEWAALAFFFGLFFEHLAEPTGLRKGLRFGLIVLAITLPWRLLAASQGRAVPSVIAFDALELVLFVSALGLLFDLIVLGIDMSQFSQIRAAVGSLTATSGLRPVAIFAGGLLTAGAVAITSVLEGQITELVSSVLSPFLPLAGT
jgi:hypothetical protein